jgi:adenosylcobinamide kinase/adenosylcobinamide-phosphate guanylyltransferase
MTLWLNNVLYRFEQLQKTQKNPLPNENISNTQNIDDYLHYYVDELIDALRQTQSVTSDELSPSFVIISNEVGLGIIPMGESTRIFLDHCGWLNQKLAALADEVTLVTAGIPMTIKAPVVDSLAMAAAKGNKG